MRQFINQVFNKIMANALERRVPRAAKVTLKQRNIFIVPTKPSVFFVMMLMIMWLLSVNYQNSLGYGLVFLLASLFLVGIIHTYRNLAGLVLSVLTKPKSVFVGEPLTIYIKVEPQPGREYESVILAWPNENTYASIDLLENQSHSVPLYIKAHQRGRYRCGRMLIETRFPLGLFRAWSWVDLDIEAIIYPKPLNNDIKPLGFSQDDKHNEPETTALSLNQETGAEDYQGLKTYQIGDNVRHIAWKAYARGQGLYTKEYKTSGHSSRWLDWSSYQGLPIEERLSCLCYWVVKLSGEDEEFGLKLPHQEIPLGRGEAHRKQALCLLALWDEGDMAQ